MTPSELAAKLRETNADNEGVVYLDRAADLIESQARRIEELEAQDLSLARRLDILLTKCKINGEYIACADVERIIGRAAQQASASEEKR